MVGGGVREEVGYRKYLRILYNSAYRNFFKILFVI